MCHIDHMPNSCSPPMHVPARSAMIVSTSGDVSNAGRSHGVTERDERALALLAAGCRRMKPRHGQFGGPETRSLREKRPVSGLSREICCPNGRRYRPQRQRSVEAIRRRRRARRSLPPSPPRGVSRPDRRERLGQDDPASVLQSDDRSRRRTGFDRRGRRRHDRSDRPPPARRVRSPGRRSPSPLARSPQRLARPLAP